MLGRYAARGSSRAQSHSSHLDSLGCFKSLAGALTFDAPSVLRNPHGLGDTLDAFACSLHFTTSVPLLFSNTARHPSIIRHHHGMGPRAGGYKEEPAPVAGDPVSHVNDIPLPVHLSFLHFGSAVCTALLLWFCIFTIVSGWRPPGDNPATYKTTGRLSPESIYMVCAHLPRHYRSTLPCNRQGPGRVLAVTPYPCLPFKLSLQMFKLTSTNLFLVDGSAVIHLSWVVTLPRPSLLSSVLPALFCITEGSL